MGRSGYVDDGFDCPEDCWAHIRWRGAVESSLRGKRGQAFLKELLAAMDAMPVKELIPDRLEADGSFCTLGVVGNARGIDMSNIDYEDPQQLSDAFGIAKAMCQEIEYMNDEGHYYNETPAERWRRMRAWVASEIKA